MPAAMSILQTRDNPLDLLDPGALFARLLFDAVAVGLVEERVAGEGEPEAAQHDQERVPPDEDLNPTAECAHLPKQTCQGPDTDQRQIERQKKPAPRRVVDHAQDWLYHLNRSVIRAKALSPPYPARPNAKTTRPRMRNSSSDFVITW